MAYKMEGDEAASSARTRAAFADAADAVADLRDAKLENAAARLQRIQTQLDGEQAGAARALENGAWEEHAQRQRRLSELAAERVHVEHEWRRLEAQPLPARGDPVQALIQSRASEPLTQRWLMEHPSDALALATGSDPRRAAKIQAAHNDALAEGHPTGSRQYLEHVDRYLGGGGGNERQPGKRVVHVVKRGQAASGDNELTKGEYTAATESVCWGNENPAKRGQPVGV